MISLGRWHHFAAVASADLGVLRIYVDGDLAQEVPYLNNGSDIRATDAPLHFGTNWHDWFRCQLLFREAEGLLKADEGREWPKDGLPR